MSALPFVERIPFPAAGPTAPPTRRIRFGQDPRHAALFAQLQAQWQAAGSTRLTGEIDAGLLALGARASPLDTARALSKALGGARLLLKREDLAGPERHQWLAVAAQALVARKLGRTELVASSRDGHLGVITASVAALLGLKATVCIDAQLLERHSANAYRIKLLGAEVRPVEARALPNHDIREAALGLWAQRPSEAFLVTGLDAAPDPYPEILRLATGAIGRECRRQLLTANGALPAAVLARGRDSADALGMFPAFLEDTATRLVCVETVASGEGSVASDNPFDPFRRGLTTRERKVARAIHQGLEYPGVGREHDWLRATGRVEAVPADIAEARRAIRDFSQQEGFIPPVETAQVLAHACALARGLPPSAAVVAVVGEQARHDIWEIGRLMGVQL